MSVYLKPTHTHTHTHNHVCIAVCQSAVATQSFYL